VTTRSNASWARNSAVALAFGPDAQTAGRSQFRLRREMLDDVGRLVGRVCQRRVARCRQQCDDQREDCVSAHVLNHYLYPLDYAEGAMYRQGASGVREHMAKDDL
jgi:hypothetical protein